MTFRDWVQDSRNRVSENGITGLKRAIYEFYVGIWRNIGRRYNYGRSIWDDEWDICVVLDACRWDLVSEVESNRMDGSWDYSVASSSGEWIPKTFDKKDNSEVAYVTANPYTEDLLDEDDFFLLDEVWRYGFDEETRTIPADVVTDQAILASRKNPKKLIVHYMQPHHPFVPQPMDEGIPLREFGHQPWDNVWHKLRKGKVDRRKVWQGYASNLEYVLEHVETLLNNTSGEVLITSDHGNLLGEWGMYAHPDWVPVKDLKRVPWVKTEAENVEDYSPTDHRGKEQKVDRKDQLEALGYR